MEKGQTMKQALDKLIQLIQVKQLDETLFEGNSLDIGTGRVYGGQVLGQALKAAQLTVGDNKSIHSMHAYFLREGNHSIPITYHVDISRNGRSFSTRRVTALQENRPIFITDMSFQIQETGLDYQANMPSVTDPETLIKQSDDSKSLKFPDRLQNLVNLTAPFDLLPVPTPGNNINIKSIWVKTKHKIGDDPDTHRALLAYISDYGLVTTALLPHMIEYDSPNMQLASIDHAMWFHRPFRVDEWLLYYCEPVSTSNARGLARGSLFDTRGLLIASTIQEGLVRQIKKGE
ncbi:MAG: acyl-CoA thioesterase II, partial [Gammaproteobacteria bacterium]|nr:acyl-CoA thioesterase II [Gammaproteobacteria bacterium]